MSKPIKILLTIFCILGIYSFLISLTPNKQDPIFSKLIKSPVIKPITFVTPGPSPSPTTTGQPQVATPTAIQTSAVNTASIIYFDGKSFSPEKTTVKLGETITIKNISTDNMWIASEPYPAADIYPELNSGKLLTPGENFNFTSSKLGSFGFNNYIEPGIKGTLEIVESK